MFCWHQVSVDYMHNWINRSRGQLQYQPPGGGAFNKWSPVQDLTTGMSFWSIVHTCLAGRRRSCPSAPRPRSRGRSWAPAPAASARPPSTAPRSAPASRPPSRSASKCSQRCSPPETLKQNVYRGCRVAWLWKSFCWAGWWTDTALTVKSEAALLGCCPVGNSLLLNDFNVTRFLLHTKRFQRDWDRWTQEHPY